MERKNVGKSRRLPPFCRRSRSRIRDKNGKIEGLKNGKRNKGARRLKCKNVKIEKLKGGNRNQGALKAQRKLAPRVSEVRRNRKKGALKAQIQSAQGSALGHGAYPSIPAPCKGSYIKIKKMKNGNMELYRRDLRPDL
jgi:hypothetical protein